MPCVRGAADEDRDLSRFHRAVPTQALQWNAKQSPAPRLRGRPCGPFVILQTDRRVCSSHGSTVTMFSVGWTAMGVHPLLLLAVPCICCSFFVSAFPLQSAPNCPPTAVVCVDPFWHATCVPCVASRAQGAVGSPVSSHRFQANTWPFHQLSKTSGFVGLSM